MRDMELREYVLKKALASGICQEWAERISKVGGIEELLQMYVDGIDFCMEKDFPSRQDLVRLGAGTLLDYGIYVDKSLELQDQKFAVLLGNCNGELHYSGYSVGQAYVRHTSNANIIASGNSFVVIDVFDTSTLNVKAYESAKVLVNIYCQAKVTSQSEGNGIIKIVHKNKSTY